MTSAKFSDFLTPSPPCSHSHATSLAELHFHYLPPPSPSCADADVISGSSLTLHTLWMIGDEWSGRQTCLPSMVARDKHEEEEGHRTGSIHVALFVNDRGRESLGLDLAFCHSRPARMDNMLHEGGWRGGKGLAWRGSSAFLLIFQQFLTQSM